MTQYIMNTGASKLNLKTRILNGKRFELFCIFTTQNGEWYASDKPYCIPAWAINRYDKPEFMERGAATHLFVRCEDEDGIAVPALVQFNNPQNTTILNTGDKASGWQNMPIFEGYDPDHESGPWSVSVDGGDYSVDGLGLPHKLHVSTFIVYRKAEIASVIPPVVTPPSTGWPVQEVALKEPTVLRITGGVPFDIEVR